MGGEGDEVLGKKIWELFLGVISMGINDVLKIVFVLR